MPDLVPESRAMMLALHAKHEHKTILASSPITRSLRSGMFAKAPGIAVQ